MNMIIRERRATALAAWLALIGAWLVALTASLGAIFIGEVMGQAPCVLCWFQRAFMFPGCVWSASECPGSIDLKGERHFRLVDARREYRPKGVGA